MTNDKADYQSKNRSQNGGRSSESSNRGYADAKPRRYDASRQGKPAPRYTGERPARPRYEGDRPRYAGDKPRYEGERPRRDADRPRYEGDRPRYAGDKPRYEGERPRRDVDRPRYQGERPRYDNERPAHSRYEGDKPRHQGDRPRYEGERPRRDGDRPRYEGERPSRPRYEGDRPRYQSDRPRYEGERPSRPRYEGDRPRYEGSRPKRSEYRPPAARPYRGAESGEHGPDYKSERPFREGRRFDAKPSGKIHVVEADKQSRRSALHEREERLLGMTDKSFATTLEELREDRLEGRNPVQEAIRAGRTIDKLWILRGPDGRVDPLLLQMGHEVRSAGGVVLEVEKVVLDKLSQTHAHQGVIAQTAMHHYYELEEILALAQEKNEKPFILVLDEIQDAYNLGSVLRIADAAGAHGVVFAKRRAIGLDAVVAKASAGAIEHVRCCRVNNLVQSIEQLKAAGLWIVGTAMDGSPYTGTSCLSESLALVIGSEGSGMRDIVRKACDQVLSIPMRGSVNSLNAAVATGVLVFEALRLREQNGTSE